MRMRNGKHSLPTYRGKIKNGLVRTIINGLVTKTAVSESLWNLSK
jgi:hypothetical protein